MTSHLLEQHRERYPEGLRPSTLKTRQFVFKLLAGSTLPAHWIYREYRELSSQANRSGNLNTGKATGNQTNSVTNPDNGKAVSLEIVSHCWKYTHYLAFQLGSLLSNPPPANMQVTMTVFYSSEDKTTTELLKKVGAIAIPGIHWNWQELPPAYLFRRTIGRNFAARSSTADWVWFTDCDETFQQGCLETLCEKLPQSTEYLLFPQTEYRTAPLDDDELRVDLSAKDWREQLAGLPLDFHGTQMTRATGPLQITRGDIARQFGYCDAVSCYQYPEDSWAKAHEDRVFRWLLGTNGTPIDVPGVYRIQHTRKGRQSSSSLVGKLRQHFRHRRYQRVKDDFGGKRVDRE